MMPQAQPISDNTTSSRGLLLVMNNKQLDAYNETNAASALPAAPVITALAGHIDACWTANKIAKSIPEEIGLQCLRARAGEYDPTILAQLLKQGETSPVYMMIPDIKCRAAISWIKEGVLPPGEAAFRLDPTPIPELPPEMQQEAKAKIVQGLQTEMQQQGINFQELQKDPDAERKLLTQVAERVKKELQKMVQEEAMQDADQMTKEVNDELTEGNWYDMADDFIDDFVTFPCAFAKGPVVRRKPVTSWEQDENGQSRLVVSKKLVKEYQRVSFFDLYPSSGAKTLNDGNLIEHIRFTPSDLQDMIGVEGYDEKAIREVLNLYAVGGLKQWLAIDSARNLLESRYHPTDSMDPRIDALKYMGDVQGKILLSWGMTTEQIKDPDLMYPVVCVKIGPHVISAKLNDHPLKDRGYYTAAFCRQNGSIYGRSIPMMIKDVVRICNGAARALVRNMGIASGPQVWINESRLQPGQEKDKMWPWRVWRYTDGDIKNRSDQPMGFFMPDSIVSELLAIYRHFYDQASEVSGVPAYTYGSDKIGGAGATASGLSMLLDTTAKGLREGVLHLDKGLTKPSVQNHWLLIMMTEPDRAKGDVKVVPRATEYLIVLAQIQNQLREALQITANPIDMQIIGNEGRGEILREYLKRTKLSVDRIVPDRNTLVNKSAEQKFIGMVQNLSKALGIDPRQLIALAQQGAAGGQGQPALAAPAGGNQR